MSIGGTRDIFYQQNVKIIPESYLFTKLSNNVFIYFFHGEFPAFTSSINAIDSIPAEE
jgi:hypothetical protein